MEGPMSSLTYASIFFRSQFLASIPYPTSDFSNQTIIVTGSNTGLGLEAVRHFIRLNAARVIMAVRTVSKGEAAADSVFHSGHAERSRIEVWPLDLTSYDSVKAFGEQVQRLERLDAVVSNAGIMTHKWETAEGNESHVTVNVVSPVLLALLVLPKLRESANRFGTRGRLTFNGSDLHYIAQFKEQYASGSLFDALNDKSYWGMPDRYATSKLLLLYAVRILAELSPVTPDSNVTINCLTPGLCKSDIFRELSGLQGSIVNAGLSVVARSTEVGSRALVHAVHPEVGVETHGTFLMDCKVFPNGPNVDSPRGQDLQERFHTELFEKLESIQRGVTTV